MPLPDDNHLWLSLTDHDDNTTWLFDTAFLLSSYNCIYGRGCPSVDAEPDPTGELGCCVHGAHLVDKQDRKAVLASADRLSESEWQFKELADSKDGPLKRNKAGDWVTRRVDGACIFLNRADFEGGAGCALHGAALARAERPMDWKPDVCWQVPIRLDIHEDDYGHEAVMVRAWERRDWGPGGEDFHWWCIDSNEAFGAAVPVYVSCRDELIEMVGEPIYQRLAEALHRAGPQLSGGVVVQISERPARHPT